MSDIKVYLLGESGKAALGAAARAEAAADGVTQARDVAVAASLTAPNVYTSTSAGLAAVGEGQTFWVSSGDSLVLYRDVSGVATLVYTMTRGLATVADLGDLAALPIDVASAYVQAVDADYAWQAGSDLTPDGWAVVEPDGGEDGNWVLASDALTLPASGSRVTDTANANAAGVSLAANGKALRLLPTTYLFTQWIFPIVGALIVNASPQTVIDLDLEPDGSPATAGLYCAPGSVASTTTVSASNTVSNYTVSVAGTVTVGKFVRIRDNVSGTGFHGSTYEVKGRSGSGPYTLTLDRPVMSQFGAGDEVSVFNAVPTGHRILGRPTVVGRGTRMFEFICTIGCEADVIFMPDEVEDVVGSFDTFGHSNKASGIIRINGSGAIDGFYLETQENSVTAFDEVSGFTGVGVSHFDCTGCDDYSFVTACGAGIAQRGDGNVKGCNDCGVYGTYNSNTGTGIEIVNGSRNAKVKAVARFNPTNLALGDGAGGNVTNPYVEGLFDGATVAGITVFSSVLGAKAGAIDTSGSAFGINAQGNIQIAAWTHTGTAANGALLNTGVVVTITKVDINTTSAVSVIKTTGSGLTTVNGGSVVAANNSNIFYSADTAISFIGSVTGSSGGAFSVGAYAEAGARVVLLPGANFSGCNTETGGDGTKQIYAEWRKLLTRTVASVGTDANTTEKTLQSYTIPANLLKIGQKVVVRAWGTTANNANTKTLRVKFGGTAVIDQALPTSAAAGWVAESEFFITGTDAQDYLASVKAAGTTTPSAGSLTKDDGAAIAILVTGQNGTSSANDIVCRGLEVIHMSA